MKNCKWLVVCLALTVALFSASASYGQVLIGGGSSALWPSVGIAAVTGDPITGVGPVCGSQFWTGGSGSASSIATAVDSRGGGIHPEPGTLWVAWDSDTSPSRVCADISIDSVVGERVFLERNVSGVNGSLALAAAAKYTLGANKVAFAADSTSCSASGSLTFNVDIAEASGSTATVTPHTPVTNFSDFFANGASVVIASSPVSGFNGTYDGGTGHQPTIGGVGSFDPTSFTVKTAGSALGTDNSGTATATVTANCPGIPSAVYAMLAASPNFTVAFTDIRPEDGVYAFHRANDAGSFPTDPTTAFMDYNGKGILSSYSTSVAYPVAFDLTGSDPISHFNPLPPVVTQSIGADPIVIIANNTDTTVCGLGNSVFTDVSSNALARAYEGLAGATQDLSPLLVNPVPPNNGCGLWPVEREMLSGTYNTFEWQVIRPASDRTRSQENFNIGYNQSNNNGTACAAWVGGLPASVGTTLTYPNGAPATNPVLNNYINNFNSSNCGNPLNIQLANYSTGASAIGYYSGFGGNRTRVIGTGEMVNVINGGSGTSTSNPPNPGTSTGNSIGYAFYSLGTFGKKPYVKYVTLDGSDPLYTSYTANPLGAGTIIPGCSGAVNTGTFACTNPQPNFAGVVNGDYKVWEPLHVIYQGTSISTCPSPFTGFSIGCLVQAAQDQAATNVKDFIPVQTCGTVHGSCTPTITFNYFRSHYQNVGPAPHDGNQPPSGACVGLVPVEAGGDMAGAILPKQSDYTQQNSIGCGSELTNLFQ